MAQTLDKAPAVGDKIRFTPTGWEGKTEFGNGMKVPNTVVGTVTYVQRRGIFCVAEAEVDGSTIRETILLRRHSRADL